jgi:hypothetical protein
MIPAIKWLFCRTFGSFTGEDSKSLTIELPSELEEQLRLAAAREGKAPALYVQSLLVERLAAGDVVIIPGIADYEVRRELLRAGKLGSVQRLDELIPTLEYLPMDTGIIRPAAELWADSRIRG